MNVIPIKLRLSNAYLVMGDQPILIDTGSPGETDAIAAALAEKRIHMRELALILLTHGHVDHAGSAGPIRMNLPIPLACHVGDVDMVRKGENRPLQAIGLEAKIVKQMIPNEFPRIAPDVKFEENFRLDEYGVAGEVIHTPGHTAGSVSVMLDSGEAIVGDVLRGGYLGGTLMPTKPLTHYFAEDSRKIKPSLEKIMSYNPHTLYVGHGGPLSADAVRRYMRKL